MDPVSVKWLRTVADVLRHYHRQPEYKFLGGSWNEEGVLRRRHVFVDTIEGHCQGKFYTACLRLRAG
jgi:hypothetical protein